MKILVTGGAGYIGGSVAILAAERGHSIAVYDNLCRSKRSAAPSVAEFIQGDIADVTRLEQVLRTGAFEAVLHFAALAEVGESMVKPELYFRNNTAGTLGLVEAMVRAGVKRLVFSSTAAVYGEPLSTPISEESPLAPTNPYGESKLQVERMLNWMNKIHGLNYAILRYFNVAGALPGRGEAHEPESHLIPLVLDAAIGRRKTVGIFGRDYPTRDGTCIRDYIHIRDLAEAHFLALDAISNPIGHADSDGRDRPARLVYNLGNGQGFSVREVIESARRVTGRPIQVEEKPRRPGDPAVLVASSAKIARELGWKPRFTNLDDIVASAWEWHQKRVAALPAV